MYKGVGWNSQGLHAQGYNSVSLGLAFFGNKLGDGHPLCPSARELSTLSSSAPLFQHSCLFSLHHIVLFDDGPSLEVLFSFGFYDMHFLVLVLLSGLHPCETAEATTDTA